ncbi:MAG: P-loop NTPase fold protein [Anaerovoracaceae bacterium]
MNPIKNNGNYFIKDAELPNSERDQFKHQDIAKNIINIIENNAPPFNIAIVGKWGLGKSSLINMVKQHLAPKKEEYIIEDINAWKYEKEALKRVLLRKTLSNLEYTDKSALTEFLDGLTSHKGQVDDNPKTFCEHFKTEWLPLFVDAILIYVIGVILSIVGQCIISQINVSQFDFDAWISFLLSSFATNFYIPLLVVLLGKYINVSKGKYNFKITPPITSVDEYEMELEKRLSKERYKNKKIIITVDDLDRLTPNKIVEALDAIKAFVGYPNFVFIVPFDDTILKDAIKKEKTNFVYNEHLTIESDLFLDKLFQYKISLPSVIQSNIPQYAIDASRQDASDLVELCGEENFDLICKEILIHKKVSTPRQAKKIINTFANNLLLGYRRESNGVEEGVFTSLNGKRFLAKISVLQSDYPIFYTNLFVDNNLMTEFLDFTDNENKAELHNELLLPYFVKKDSSYILNKTGESLSMFLHRTASVTADNVSRFLYLNDDRLSELFGNEFSLAIRDGLSSGAYSLVRDKIESSKNKDITNLLYEVLSNSDPIEFELCCIGIINISDMSTVKSELKLLSLLNDRLSSIFVSRNKIAAKNLDLEKAIAIFAQHNNYAGVDKLILNQFINEENSFEDTLPIFFENERTLSNGVKSYVKELIAVKCATDKTKLNFDTLFGLESLNIDDVFTEYLSDLDMFKRLYDLIVSAENYDAEDATVLSFVSLFRKHVQNGSADKVLKTVSSNLNNSEFAELLIADISDCADMFKDEAVTSTVAISLIEASHDSIKSNVNRWLSSASWKIPAKQSTTVDTYLAENLSSECIDEMLLNIANKSQVSLIPKTIDAIHNAIFDDLIEISTLYQLQKQYDDLQNVSLIEKLMPAFAYSNSDNDDLDYATELLGLMAGNKGNQKYVTQIADYILSQSRSYPAQMLTKIHVFSEFKQGIADSSIQSLITWASSNVSSYPMICLKIIDIFKSDINTSQYLTLGDSLMNYATEDTLELSLSLLRKFRSAFIADTSQLKTYRDFLVSHLDSHNCRKAIIKDIFEHYKTIGELKEFIYETSKYSDVTEEAIVAIVKFSESYTESQITADVKYVIEVASNEQIESIDDVLFRSFDDKYNSALLELLETADKTISVPYGMNLLRLAIRKSEVSTELKTNIMCIMLEMCDDVMLPEILTESKGIGRITRNTEKRKVGEVLYKVFKSTSTEKFKKEIFSLAKSTGTITAFEIDEEKNKRDFTDEESQLLKRK